MNNFVIYWTQDGDQKNLRCAWRPSIKDIYDFKATLDASQILYFMDELFESNVPEEFKEVNVDGKSTFETFLETMKAQYA